MTPPSGHSPPTLTASPVPRSTPETADIDTSAFNSRSNCNGRSTYDNCKSRTSFDNCNSSCTNDSCNGRTSHDHCNRRSTPDNSHKYITTLEGGGSNPIDASGSNSGGSNSVRECRNTTDAVGSNPRGDFSERDDGLRCRENGFDNASRLTTHGIDNTSSGVASDRQAFTAVDVNPGEYFLAIGGPDFALLQQYFPDYVSIKLANASII